ncbi:MAG: prolipoprotein diacylglyceryl transferase [Clostridia bacterium]|nr:prolipoprotein diacylglyceryl transferase [Clostridia bacterium]
MYPYAIFHIGEAGVYPYGVCIGIGILACILVYFKFTDAKRINKEVQDFGFMVAIFAIALGFLAAKAFQALYNYIETGKWDFNGAGITAMGGFVGGAIAFVLIYFVGGIFVFRRNKGVHVREFNKILLTAPACITIAHAFGRIGCLMAGCCRGALLSTTEYVFGGIWMQGTIDKVKVWGYYVPTQLYEALFLFALFGLLTYLFYKRSNITHAVYLFAYGVWRIIIEIFRDDARGGFVLGLAPSQWQSIIFIAGSIIIIAIYLLKEIPIVLPRGS